MKNYVKGFGKHIRINEQGEPEIERLYGTGRNSRQDLIKMLVDLIQYIDRANPSTAEDFELIKDHMKQVSDDIKSHQNYREFKNSGFEFQEQVISMDDWSEEFKKAAHKLYAKAYKKGLIIE